VFDKRGDVDVQLMITESSCCHCAEIPEYTPDVEVEWQLFKAAVLRSFICCSIMRMETTRCGE